jgi:hypothetical protein
MAVKKYIVNGRIFETDDTAKKTIVNGRIVETEAAAGGLSIPVAAYHYNHNIGSNN